MGSSSNEAPSHAPQLDEDTARLVSSLECDIAIQTGVLKQYGKINDAVKEFLAQKAKIIQEKQEVERLREEVTHKNKELTLEMEQLRWVNQELIRENNELNLELVILKETAHGVQTRSTHTRKLQAHDGGGTAASEEETFDQVITSRIIAEDSERKRELNEIRKELIQVFADMEHWRQTIRIKMMGQINVKPFLDAAHREYTSDDDIAKVEAAENCSAWQVKIQNPLWHPYRKISEDGPREEVLNDDDETLKQLKTCGGPIYDAVIEALKEMNEYDMSGRSVVPELWNYREGRKATVVECIQFLGKKARQKNCKKRKTNIPAL